MKRSGRGKVRNYPFPYFPQGAEMAGTTRHFHINTFIPTPEPDGLGHMLLSIVFKSLTTYGATANFLWVQSL